MFEFKLAALLASTAAVAAGVAAPAAGANFGYEVVIIALCTLGAIVGGFLGVAWKPGETPRQNYFLFGTNLCLGLILAPMLVMVAGPHLSRYLQPGPIFCIAAGGLVSAFGTMLIRPIIPVFLSSVRKRAAKIAAQIADEDDSPRRPDPPEV